VQQYEKERVSSYSMTLGNKKILETEKEEALDRTLGRTRFGRGYGPVVRQTRK
jgi:hypothetical protein